MRDFGFTFEPEIVKAKASEKKGDLSIWAYASTYDVDSDECQITREALEGAKNDLLTYSTVLFNHDMDRPIGRVTETKIDDKGLLVKIILSQTEEVLMKKIQDGTLSKLSIRGRAYDFNETTPDEDGRSILQITKIKLFEVSFVPVPANSNAKTISSAFEKSLITKMMNADDIDVKNSLLADLQLLSGRMVEDDKAGVDKVVEYFKTTNTNMKKELKYNFDETTTDRPVFQLNLSDDSSVELSEDNTFRKQILKKGKWHHWSADNGVLDITDKNLDDMVANFEKGLLDSVPVPLTHSNNPSDNTGCVTELIKTEDGLDAVIEIKDASVVEKIKEGLITAISASFDPNYMVKKTKEFVGPVLLHAALVAEPYIKGMTGFVALSEDFEGRTVVSLEDSEPNVQTQLNMVFKLLGNIQKQIGEDEETETTEEDTSATDESTDTDETTEEDVEKAKKGDKKGDKCKTSDGKDGLYAEDKDGKLVCKATKKSIEDDEDTEDKSSTEESSDETDVEESTEGTEEDKSEEVAKTDVDLSDANTLYDSYLEAGQIVPAQKEAFINLCEVMKSVQLSDETVDVKKALDSFLKSQPKVVNFDEAGGVDDGSGEDDKTEESTTVVMPEDVKSFYTEKMNMSEDQATKAWGEAQQSNVGQTEKSTLFE